MNITKSKLKQIIKEEIENLPEIFQSTLPGINHMRKKRKEEREKREKDRRERRNNRLKKDKIKETPEAKPALPEWGKRLSAIGELAKNFFPNVKMEDRSEFENDDTASRVEWLRQLADFLEQESYSAGYGMSDTGMDEEYYE